LPVTIDIYNDTNAPELAKQLGIDPGKGLAAA